MQTRGCRNWIEVLDYYAFGATLPGRTGSSSNYRYGFNGKENDSETGTQDYGFRIYNPSLGKFLSVDPLTKSYPMLTPYQFASNRPIDGIDLDGKEWERAIAYNPFDGHFNVELKLKIRIENCGHVQTVTCPLNKTQNNA